jgi:putative FmdB family regulatory protein
MPLYEYQCDECGIRFERRQRMTDDAITECPECGGSVHRLYFPVGIVFKGSGFYVTDNRSRKSTTRKPTENASEKSESSTSRSSSESSSESKSESKTGSTGSTGSKSGDKS